MFSLMKCFCLYLILCCLFIGNAEINLPKIQYDALQDLYNSTQGNQWIWQTPYSDYGYPWNFSDPLSDPCNASFPWQGITCIQPCSSYFCHITTISLVGTGLNGTLPQSIGYFPWLNTLNLDSNHITSTLPDSIGLLKKLEYLQLMSNVLTGSISPQIFENITQFSMIFLDNNAFTGLIPSSLFQSSSLFYVSLENNLFSGSLISDISNLSHLQYLILNNNLFTNTLPTSIGQLTQLIIFNIQYNLFSQSLPSSIGLWTKLTNFQGEGNMFSGELPSSIGNCTSLISWMGYNNFFTGLLPQEIANLKTIQEFYLSVNYLTGQLPSSIGSMTQLAGLFLNSNLFSHTIPSELANLTQLMIVMLFENHFTGTIPSSFGQFPHLMTLYLSNNQLTGTIPSSLGNITTLMELVLNSNQLTGSLPSSFGNIPYLGYLLVYENQLTGSIPSTYEQLIYLENIYLFDNYFTGSLPTFLNNYQLLLAIDIENNLFTGNIPSQLFTLPKLSYCYLSNNQLIGFVNITLSSSLLSLEQIVLNSNYFSGIFPLQNPMNHTNNIHILDISNNGFTGSIPMNIINNKQLEYLNIGSNYFTNTLPSILFILSNLKFFNGQMNYFLGYLPVSLDNYQVTMLQYYDLSMNLLTGIIPSQYTWYFPQLIYLNLANNFFIGSLTSLSFPMLKVLYIQNNQLTGSIPSQLLLGSQLEIFMSSLNCFTGSLPDTFCQNTNLTQLILDGLHSSSGCIHSIFSWDIYSSYMIQHGVHGTIPSCYFTLPNLEILHLSGNNLHGTIPSTNNIQTNLTSIILSNNLLTGNIPSLLFTNSHMIYLDLSFNWLTSWSIDQSTSFIQTTSINRSVFIQPGLHLQDNHLSGHIPNAWIDNTSHEIDINILEGNMFTCNSWTREHLPSQDPNEHSYQCGSDYTNTSLYLSLFFLAFIVLFSCYCYGSIWFYSLVTLLSKLGETTHQLLLSLEQTTNISLNSLSQNNINNISSNNNINTSFIHLQQVSLIYNLLGKIFSTVFIWLMVVITPIYIIFSTISGTYHHQYAWIVSSAYLTGFIPAIVLFIVFIMILCYIIGILFPYLQMFPILSQIFQLICFQMKITSSISSTSTTFWSSITKYTQPIKLFSLLLLEIFIVLMVNFSYILAINHGYNHNIMICISLAISVFKICWGNFILLGQGRVYLEQMLQLQIPTGWILFLSIFNNLIAPYIAELFVSSNCFLYAISQPPSVNTIYYEVQCRPTYECLISPTVGTYDTYCLFDVLCDNTQSNILSSDITPQTLTTISYLPPFHYNFTCSSSLLSSFVYIFIYRYLFTGLIEPLIFGCIKYCQQKADTFFVTWNIQFVSFGTIGSISQFIVFLTKFLPILMKYDSFQQMKSTEESRERIEKDTEENNIQDKEIIERTQINQTLLNYEEITLDKTIYAINHTINLGERSLVRLITDMTMFLSFGILFPPLGILIFVCIIKDIVFEQYFLSQYLRNIQTSHALEQQSIIQTKLIQIISILNEQFLTWLSYLWSSIWWSLFVSVCFWSFSLYDTLGSQSGAIHSLWILFVMIFAPIWIFFLWKSIFYSIKNYNQLFICWQVSLVNNHIEKHQNQEEIDKERDNSEEFRETELAISPKPSDIKISDRTSLDFLTSQDIENPLQHS